MKGIISIDEVVRSLIADEGRNTLHKYIWYLHYALDFVREWSIDYHTNIVTKKLKLDENKGVCFPDDYVNFNSVGVKIGDRIMAFTQDSTLTSITDGNEPNKRFVDEYESSSPYSQIIPYSFYNLKTKDKNDRELDVYLMGATYPGYFNIDEKRKRIQLSAEVLEDYIYLEYVTNGLKCSEMSVIPEIAYAMCKEWIRWKYAKNKFGSESARAKSLEQDYSVERDRVLVRRSKLSYMSILGALKRNYSQKTMN